MMEPFVPYDGQDPTINADTNFYGSTDPNAADYNMIEAHWFLMLI